MAQGTFYRFDNTCVGLSEQTIGLQQPMTVYLIAEGHNAGITPTDGTGDNLPNLSDYTQVTGTGYAPKALISQTTTRVGGTNTLSSGTFTGTDKWDSNPAGPNNIKSALLARTSDGLALGYWDMTVDDGVTPVSLQVGPISLNFGAGSGTVYRAVA